MYLQSENKQKKQKESLRIEKELHKKIIIKNFEKVKVKDKENFVYTQGRPKQK